MPVTELLELKTIKDFLFAEQYDKNICIGILDTVDSTNNYLLKLIQENKVQDKYHVVLAEEQTAGRGRNGKIWQSPYASNLYLSLAVSVEPNYQNLIGASLIIGIAVAKALQNLNLEVKIKWPNDIYCNNAKLGGILIESIKINSKLKLVIGIGLNVLELPKELAANVQQAHTSLSRCLKNRQNNINLSRNFLAALVIKEILFYLDLLQQQGFKYFLAVWKNMDWLYGKLITIKTPNHDYTGIASGINDFGELKITTNLGNVLCFNNGSVIVFDNANLNLNI